MLAKAVLSDIARNEALTRGLADPEARILMDWLIGRVESSGAGWIDPWCKRARSIARFVRYWCHEQNWGAACQLAAAERFHWPLPTRVMDPCDLMEGILEHEPAVLS